MDTSVHRTGCSPALRNTRITTAPLMVLVPECCASGTITSTAVMTFFPAFMACLNVLQQIPAKLPALFAFGRMAVPAAILSTTTTEQLAPGIGMGMLMALSASTSACNTLSCTTLWSAAVILSVIVAWVYISVRGVERHVLRRYASEQLTR